MGETEGGNTPPLNPIRGFGEIPDEEAGTALATLHAFIRTAPDSINTFSDLAQHVEPIGKAAMTVLLRYGNLAGQKTAFRDFSATGGITPQTIDDVADDVKAIIEQRQEGVRPLQSVYIQGTTENARIDVSSSGQGGIIFESNWGKEDFQYMLHLPTEEPITPKNPKEMGLTPWGWEMQQGTTVRYEPALADSHNTVIHRDFFQLAQRAVRDMIQIVPNS